MKETFFYFFCSFFFFTRYELVLRARASWRRVDVLFLFLLLFCKEMTFVWTLDRSFSHNSSSKWFIGSSKWFIYAFLYVAGFSSLGGLNTPLWIDNFVLIKDSDENIKNVLSCGYLLLNGKT